MANGGDQDRDKSNGSKTSGDSVDAITILKILQDALDEDDFLQLIGGLIAPPRTEQPDATAVGMPATFDFEGLMQGADQQLAAVDSLMRSPPDSSNLGILSTGAVGGMAGLGARAQQERAQRELQNVNQIFQMMGLAGQ